METDFIAFRCLNAFAHVKKVTNVLPPENPTTSNTDFELNLWSYLAKPHGLRDSCIHKIPVEHYQVNNRNLFLFTREWNLFKTN